MKIRELIADYLQHLKTLNRTSATLRTVKYDLFELVRFLEGEKIHTVQALTADIVADYQQHLAFKLTHKNRPMTIGSQQRLLCAACGFTRYLKNKDYLATDPGQAIELPRMPDALPKAILSANQIKRLINACDMQSCHGFRRRIILEILYDTGMRRLELTHVRLADIDLSAGYIHIRQGKGGKDRVVPVSGRVCELVQTYIVGVRCEFVKGDDPGYLLLNRWGQRMQPGTVWRQVKLAATFARINKAVTTHSLRHSCATHMLKNGAPIRHIQEMLGHASLESTQIYTRVTINDLKAVHAKCHPGNKL
jgi:integrase/recombinase XerD